MTITIWNDRVIARSNFVKYAIHIDVYTTFNNTTYLGRSVIITEKLDYEVVRKKLKEAKRELKRQLKRAKYGVLG